MRLTNLSGFDKQAFNKYFKNAEYFLTARYLVY